MSCFPVRPFARPTPERRKRNKVDWLDDHHHHNYKNNNNDNDDDNNNDVYYDSAYLDHVDDDDYRIIIQQQQQQQRQQQKEEEEEENDTCHKVLLEIVGVMGLSLLERQQNNNNNNNNNSNKSITKNLFINPKELVRKSLSAVLRNGSSGSTDGELVLNPYCVVKWKDTIIHQTHVISNDENPIWTIQTNSLCLVKIPEHALQLRQGGITATATTTTTTTTDVTTTTTTTTTTASTTTCGNSSTSTIAAVEGPLKDAMEKEEDEVVEEEKNITIEIYHESTCLGIVALSAREIWNGTGNRVEYTVQAPPPVNQLKSQPQSQTSSSSSSSSPSSSVSVSNTPTKREQHHQQQQQPQEKNDGNASAPSSAPSASSLCQLALRYRQATDEDLSFLTKLQQGQLQQLRIPPSCVATDVNFTKVKHQAMFQRRSKTITTTTNTKTTNTTKKGSRTSRSIPAQQQQQTQQQTQQIFRVKPGPDPNRPKQDTEWMTKYQMQQECTKPSTAWVSAGCGAFGTLYLEILKCQDLPNMDAFRPPNLTSLKKDKTDAFCAIVFEDNMVRTDVIWDALHPMWMPWTTRAFAFAIRHPASLLFLGVYDYDDVLLDHHDPIGRVVIDTSVFDSGMTYELHYNLQHDPRHEQQLETANTTNNMLVDTNQTRGRIVIRLRMEWENPKEAMKMSFLTPPPFIINVDNEKSYWVLQYLTVGAVDMDQASLDTIKLYWKEIISFWRSYCYCLDVVWETLLWRGSIKLPSFSSQEDDEADDDDENNNNHHPQRHSSTGISIWFPFHSMVLWVSVVYVIEHPQYIGPFCLYAIAWILLSINYHASRHPYPWKRIKPSEESSCMMLLGRRLYAQPTRIARQEGADEGALLEKLDTLKRRRASALIRGTLYFMLKVYRIYSKTGDYAVAITTDKKKEWSFLAGRLYYIHMLLKYYCKYVRRFRNFVNWKGHYTCVFTTNCIMLATAWVIFPINTILLWTIRIFAWTFLGPWMKIVDVFFFRHWYRTKEELLDLLEVGKSVDDIDPDLPNFDAILESPLFLKMIHAGRVKAEDLYKLKDMRELLFGKYSERVPYIDNSRIPSVPLPQSQAYMSNNSKSRDDDDDDDEDADGSCGYRSARDIMTATSTSNAIIPPESFQHHVPGQLLARGSETTIIPSLAVARDRAISPANTDDPSIPEDDGSIDEEEKKNN